MYMTPGIEEQSKNRLTNASAGSNVIRFLNTRCKKI
jgi:hypothetical protein